MLESKTMQGHRGTVVYGLDGDALLEAMGRRRSG
jgi:hypothetical protein